MHPFKHYQLLQPFKTTLKPHITASSPSLDTGCWLDFTRLGLPPNYILHTKLAHPRNNIIKDNKQKINFYSTLIDNKIK